MNINLLNGLRWPLRLGTWLTVAAVGVGCCRGDDASPAGNATPQPTFLQSLFGGGGNGRRTIDETAPKPAADPNDDPVRLDSPGKPDVKLYVAVAHLDEEKGQMAEAQQQYKKGLEDSPEDLRALLGYAQLKDRLGEPNEAMKLYQRAIKAHPKEGAAYNNLAIHYAQQAMYRESLAAFQRAIVLRPTEVRYRNNAATVLVKLNRFQDAFVQLSAVHKPAIAHYNLGVLMAKNGQPQPAVAQFSIALDINPLLLPARQWIERLGAVPPPAPPTAAEEPRHCRPQCPRFRPLAASRGTKQRRDRRHPGAGVASLAAAPRARADRGVAGRRWAQQPPLLADAGLAGASAIARRRRSATSSVGLRGPDGDLGIAAERRFLGRRRLGARPAAADGSVSERLVLDSTAVWRVVPLHTAAFSFP